VPGRAPSDLRRVERTARPIRQPVSLGNLFIDNGESEACERREHQPEESRRDLRVEQADRDRPAGALQHFEVLLRGMAYGEPGAFEESAKRRHVDRERIDHRDAAAPGQLNERETWEVAPLAVELGVEGVARLGQQQIDEGVQLSRLGDPPMGHAGLSPVDTSRPLAIHAS